MQTITQNRYFGNRNEISQKWLIKLTIQKSLHVSRSIDVRTDGTASATKCHRQNGGTKMRPAYFFVQNR